MTNLDVIKYLSTNKPARLAELLEDIYCCAWNDGANDRFGDESSIPNFDKWICEDAAKSGMHYSYELEQWAKAIDTTPSFTDFYTWSPVMEQVMNEVRFLENVLGADNYPDGVYNSFRREVCVDCHKRDKCLRSKMAIIECPKFENYYEI